MNKKHRWLGWTTIAAAIFTAAAMRIAFNSSAADSPPQASELLWPLDRSGKNTILLRIPQPYATANSAAQAQNEFLHPNGQSQPGGAIFVNFLFYALLPNMAPRTEENSAEFKVTGGGKVVMTLVKSGGREDFQGVHYDMLQQQYDAAVKRAKQVCITPIPPSRAVAICHDREQPDVKPPQYGLQRVGIDFKKYPHIPEVELAWTGNEDIYYKRSPSGELQAVILCTPEELKAVDTGPGFHFSPQCRQFFFFKPMNALVSANYRRLYLGNWEAIQIKMEKLLQSFIALESTTSQRDRIKK